MTNLLTLHILDWDGNGHYQMQADYRQDYYTIYEVEQIVHMIFRILDQGLNDSALPCASIELMTERDKRNQAMLLSGPVLPIDPERYHHQHVPPSGQSAS